MNRASKITQAKAELQPLKKQLDQYSAALIANTDSDLIQLLALKLQELSPQRQTIINGIKNENLSLNSPISWFQTMMNGCGLPD